MPQKLLPVTLATLGFLGASFLPLTPAEACGPDTDCMIGERHYRIRMPEGHDGKTPVGAIIYSHGYKGSAAGAMRNKSLGKAVSDLGLAFIAVKSAGDDWKLPNAPSLPTPEEQVEMAYFDRVIEDASTRFAIDTSRLMATGFSAGGMVTWHLICERSDLFAGFAPIAGTFWDPHPQNCPTQAANVLHMHGTDDPVVPLEGRPIRTTRQGNVFDVLETYRTQHGFEGEEKRVFEEIDLTCTRAENASGKFLEFCLYPGGHSFKSAYVMHAWQQFENAGAFD